MSGRRAAESEGSRWEQVLRHEEERASQLPGAVVPSRVAAASRREKTGPPAASSCIRQM
jgi:hypothetical protein